MKIIGKANLVILSLSSFVLTSPAAYAQHRSGGSWRNWWGNWWGGGSGSGSSSGGGANAVPEIDASAGLLATAAVLAALALVWELRRRRQKNG